LFCSLRNDWTLWYRLLSCDCIYSKLNLNRCQVIPAYAGSPWFYWILFRFLDSFLAWFLQLIGLIQFVFGAVLWIFRWITLGLIPCSELIHPGVLHASSLTLYHLRVITHLLLWSSSVSHQLAKNTGKLKRYFELNTNILD